jgi:hypothetical protein
MSLNGLPTCTPLPVCERGRPYDDIMPAGSVLNWVRTRTIPNHELGVYAIAVPGTYESPV